MGARVVQDASLLALADKLRTLGATDEGLLFPDGFMDGVAQTWDNGRLQGLQDGAELCSARHFVHTFVGDGSSSMTLHIPFEPDAVHVFGFDPRALTSDYCLFSIYYDLRAFGQCVGFIQHTSTDSRLTNTAFSANSAIKRYQRDADGNTTFSGVGTSNAEVFFGSGFPYTVVAVKYTEQTDAQRIEAFLSALSATGGTITLTRAKVEAAFTDTQWAALVSTCPNWTINLV